MENPNVKYYQIPSKSQYIPNPKNLAIDIYLISGFTQRLVVLVLFGFGIFLDIGGTNGERFY